MGVLLHRECEVMGEGALQAAGGAGRGRRAVRRGRGAAGRGWASRHGRHPIPDMICAVHSPRNVPANAPMSAKSTPTGTSCLLNAPATTGAEAIPPMFAVLATAMLNSSVFVSFA